MKALYCYGVGAYLLLTTGVGAAFGQAPDQTPTPHEPLLPRASDGTWTITYKYRVAPPTTDSTGSKGVSAGTPDRIASVRVEKKGAVYHVITTKVSGLLSENWCVNGIEICKAERSKSFVRLSQDNPFYVDFSKTDFDELSWMGMDNYKSVEDGPAHTKVFVFEVKNVDRRQTGLESATIGNVGTLLEQSGQIGPKADKKQAVSQFLTAQFGDSVSHALINVTTQLPVEYDDGAVVRTYTFSDALPPNAPLDILELIQAMRDQVRRTYVRASPP